MLAAHPNVARLLSALLALGAVVALLGAYGIVAAVLGGLAWFALPERRAPRLTRSDRSVS